MSMSSTSSLAYSYSILFRPISTSLSFLLGSFFLFSHCSFIYIFLINAPSNFCSFALRSSSIDTCFSLIIYYLILNYYSAKLYDFVTMLYIFLSSQLSQILTSLFFIFLYFLICSSQ